MAWTQAQLDTLEEAIATGARRMTYGDGGNRKEIEFHSREEMMALRKTMRDELGLNDQAKAAGRVSYASYNSRWRR